ncbi:MAG TPA: hypothetical protein VLA00_17880 [Xanthobacteraceae bacterium]|nr:hypothetical protein [Xanthobacteraceae bacterium]
MKPTVMLSCLLLVGSVAGVGALVSRPEESAALKPAQASAIRLGTLSGTAYYTVERDGFRVVTTLAEGADGRPMRFVGTLVPGQKILISVPREAGALALTAEISRQGDKVFVTDASLATQ